VTETFNLTGAVNNLNRAQVRAQQQRLTETLVELRETLDGRSGRNRAGIEQRIRNIVEELDRLGERSKELTIELQKPIEKVVKVDADTEDAEVKLLDLSRTASEILGRSRTGKSGEDETVQLIDLSKYSNEILSRTKETNKAAQDLGLTFSSAFENAILKAESLRDVLKGLAQDILRIFVRRAITEPLGNAVSDIFRASGGPVSGGSPYIVGERGPELFVPGMSGAVIPNHKLSAAGGGDIYVTNNVDGSGLSPNQLLAVLESNNQRVIGEIVQRRREGRL